MTKAPHPDFGIRWSLGSAGRRRIAMGLPPQESLPRDGLRERGLSPAVVSGAVDLANDLLNSMSVMAPERRARDVKQPWPPASADVGNPLLSGRPAQVERRRFFKENVDNAKVLC